MPSSKLFPSFPCVALLLVAALAAPAGLAQENALPAAPSASASRPFDVNEYAKPRAAFPVVTAPYTPRHVEAPNLANTPRIDQLMHDGKLYISMNDAVSLALENNLDIAIARYNLNIADTDVWRAKAGASILGVNSGVVQNTPGGGAGGLGGQVGSGQGGTSVGAGGAGAGAGAWWFPPWGPDRSSPVSTPSSPAPCKTIISGSFAPLLFAATLRTPGPPISPIPRDSNGGRTYMLLSITPA